MLALACALLVLALTAGLAAAAPATRVASPRATPELAAPTDEAAGGAGEDGNAEEVPASMGADELPETTWLDDALVDLAQLELAILEQLEQDPLVPLDDRRASRWGRLDLSLTFRQIERDPSSALMPSTVSELWLVAAWRN